ncbi:MAG TPA: TSUP family transporter [Humisphaera sp.]
MDWTTLLLLFAAGLSAGLIDAIAGGGGLISLPALLSAGLPPHLAFGTNKVQATFGTVVAVQRYARAGLFAWRDMRLPVLVTYAAATAGTVCVLNVPNAVLKRFVPWVLLAIAVYLLLHPRLGANPGRRRLDPAAFALLFGALIGFYDGFIGPGTGTFWTMACVGVLGLELTRATAYTKVVNLTSNVASMLVFVSLGRVRYDLAAVMMAGQVVGGRLGAGLVLKHGAGFIRVVFIGVVLAIVGRLVWDQWAR